VSSGVSSWGVPTIQGGRASRRSALVSGRACRVVMCEHSTPAGTNYAGHPHAVPSVCDGSGSQHPQTEDALLHTVWGWTACVHASMLGTKEIQTRCRSIQRESMWLDQLPAVCPAAAHLACEQTFAVLCLQSLVVHVAVILAPTKRRTQTHRRTVALRSSNPAHSFIGVPYQPTMRPPKHNRASC